MLVTKATGEKQEFSEKKVLDSIRRAGIAKSEEQKVLQHVKSKVYEGIPTSELYRHIIEFLGKSNQPFAKSRYGLKQAIMALGPTGYPFEDYIAKLLNEIGYQTQVRQMLQGTCITHEVDVISQKDGKKHMVEVKFHNAMGIHTDSHVSMYTKARFDDVKEKYELSSAWLITNTKASSDAIAYGECMGLKVIGWSYPEGESIRDLVEKTNLIPITTLSQLSQQEIEILIKNHIVLCRDICRNPHILQILPIPKEKIAEIYKEALFVCPL